MADEALLARAYRSILLEEAGSTNTEAFARAAGGEAGPLWIMARRQTQGRGRAGRSWTSRTGNLYASLLQRLGCSQKSVHHLSLLAGVAVVDAITAAAGGRLPGLRLKWPNDILIGEAKCAGILPESQVWAAGPEVIVVVGIGINLASHPDDLGRPATHLADHGVSTGPEPMLGFLAEAMEHWLGVWNLGVGFAAIRSAWLDRAGAAGEALSVDTGRERITGTFHDLDDTGALILRDKLGAYRSLTFGDVTLTRATDRESG
jgi:BirA family transcriptional regulator, biotin operon repressor / biotin---[acetyl-CoA-carboxylase] ligase